MIFFGNNFPNKIKLYFSRKCFIKIYMSVQSNYYPSCCTLYNHMDISHIKTISAHFPSACGKREFVIVESKESGMSLTSILKKTDNDNHVMVLKDPHQLAPHLCRLHVHDEPATLLRFLVRRDHK